MDPKAALELVVIGLNRLMLNELEKVGINTAVAVLAAAIKPKEDAPPEPK